VAGSALHFVRLITSHGSAPQENRFKAVKPLKPHPPTKAQVS